MGTAHPFAMRVSGDVCGRDDGSGGDPLTNEQNVLWHGSITVGTPPVNFTGKKSRFFLNISMC
jgi:hypothetical protein